jgi:toxin ParE1/3/4
VARHSVRGADAVLQRIFEKIELAEEHQHIGIARPEISSTARTLAAGNYIVIYEPGDPKLSVVAVVHGARDPETWLD